ncbi:cytochrome c biogenesis CcdA family protein [Verrucomicrobiota bacterium]
MEWIQSASEWTRAAFDNVGLTPAAFPLAFLLGLVSSVVTACCTAPVFGVIVGYSGTRKQSDRRANLLGAFFFMLGSVVALLILGAVAGFVGQVAQTSLGRYWQIFAGLVAIVFGLATLNLLPFKLPQRKAGAGDRAGGLLGAVFFGFIMGGAVSVCSLCCNPGIFIILGVAVLQGYTVWMFGILIAYAIGFSLPLAALVLGISLGKAAIKARKAEAMIRVGAGVLLIGVGFYFLSTF